MCNWDNIIANADNVSLDEDDAPEFTDEVKDKVRPAKEVLPELFIDKVKEE